jgi:arylsulfatase
VSDTPFREYKHWEHEGGISTPLIVHWPKGIASSRRGKLESQPGHLIDIMATCVDVAGARYPAVAHNDSIPPMEGTSLAPAFRGKSLERKSPIFWEHEGNRAVRDGDWKLVAKENKPWELYNLKLDRTEQHDVASAEPGKAEKLANEWNVWAARANVLPLGGWRDRSVGTNASTKTEFTLKDGDHLDRGSAPNIAARGFTVTARFDTAGKDGVIVAQGGSAHGFTLFVQDGKLIFALRRANVLTATPGIVVPAGLHTATASAEKDGMLTLKLDDQQSVSAHAAGLLTRVPTDGLDVGEDAGGLVGSYSEDNGFGGTIESVQIKLH